MQQEKGAQGLRLRFGHFVIERFFSLSTVVEMVESEIALVLVIYECAPTTTDHESESDPHNSQGEKARKVFLPFWLQTFVKHLEVTVPQLDYTY